MSCSSACNDVILVNARIADFCNAIQGETTAAGRSGVFLEIAVIPRRVDEFVGASSGHRQAPSGFLAAVTRLRVGNLAQEDMAPAPETTDSGAPLDQEWCPNRAVFSISAWKRDGRQIARATTIKSNARPCNGPEWWLAALNCPRPETETN